ncbi:anthranilate synthase component I family protein [Humisphaera borealis]|uniref:Anthranilate synthase component I family protein n=1 Tax=Humisphaera borealis TaxID=2807512 RepID=A0A7M2WWN7_9BACT|nr:anthranilate synthase component I family protein [Humisphaera borealis]QOV89886.1 anthranilate synthase component I family protein [Humisphaera borealis]
MPSLFSNPGKLVTSPTVRLDGNGSSRWAWPQEQARWLMAADSTGHAELRCGELSEGTTDNPLEALSTLPNYLRHADLPRDARWIGFLSYDLGRWFENLPTRAIELPGVPLFAFSLHGSDIPGTPVPLRASGLRSERAARLAVARQNYLAAIRRCIDYIAAGDIFQVNLSQRILAPLRENPIDIYRRLQELTPASFGAFLQYGDFALLCNSPELFFRVDPQPDGNRRIICRPIKGTRPLLPGMDAELRVSAKDQAELAMIVDLQRNDLGRICRIGSVKVSQARTIEAHPTVYHGVATIEGTLRPDVTFVDILRAMFPCGSVTGCPKIRAMQIIDELEPVRRGPYCGAIGWIGADGSMEFNVAIRTMMVKDGLVHVPVGGGIVADSEPEAEYEETMVKARAMLAALGVSPSSL